MNATQHRGDTERQSCGGHSPRGNVPVAAGSTSLFCVPPGTSNEAWFGASSFGRCDASTFPVRQSPGAGNDLEWCASRGTRGGLFLEDLQGSCVGGLHRQDIQWLKHAYGYPHRQCSRRRRLCLHARRDCAIDATNRRHAALSFASLASIQPTNPPQGLTATTPSLP